MNSLNLRQIDGGNVIKQADFGSNLSFELLDERRRKIPELDGQTATIRLIKGDNIAYQTESLIVDSAVSFKFDRVLEKGIYVLEIVAGNYVFPSNNMVKITIEKTAGNYKPENMIKTDLVELQGKIIAIEQREHDVNQELMTIGQNQVEMTKRIEILEQKEDHDTIYDDTELSNRVTVLEQKEGHDTVYDDTAIKKELSELNQSIAKKKLYLAYAYDRYGANGFTKADVYDPFDCLIFDYLGISEKDSDNPDDYFWMPTRVASDDELSEALFEVNKLKDLHRKAPTGYALDRTTVPWTIRFDNGCELRLPTSERDKANLIYGYGFPANNNSAAAFSAPIPPLIISASRGTFTVDKFKESDEAHFHITYADYILYYPIGKSNDFNWENAYGDRVNQTVSTNGKSNFTKLMYELGIWSEADVLYLGATKK